ncbi:hypothetical protein Plav_0784 [Parvibaculum lavamentivorans DS-1]|uniref:Uncharacterized protein n=1 Tax=Parvibaculum lavamentivorans (strain DS-1 / DSM 13023 / NCIMB 13966) TaxID=402881 RepID=A7HR74_PARL1|nr:hypothetical protein [Parvibaculum lavamentivorans]ABS62407.1 hypothetical protein Plav_0784 [Parvibaculum lavamentivorans DS-1]
MSDAPDFLTVHYSKPKGESIVYSAVLAAGALIVFGMVRAPIFSSVGALLAVGVALYHWPYVARDRRALVVSPAGVTLDRLGLLPWNAISDVEIVDRYVRMIRNAELRISLRRPLNTAVDNAASVGIVRRYMYRCWKSIGPQEIAVRLSTLDAKPEIIEAAVRQHIHRSI